MRIKLHIEACLAALQRCAAQTGGQPLNKINMVATVTAEIWEEETPAFKQECKLALEREYQAALTAWEVLLADSPTRSAEIAGRVLVAVRVKMRADIVETGHLKMWLSTCSHLSTQSKNTLECVGQ
jgi:hypothetical protein